MKRNILYLFFLFLPLSSYAQYVNNRICGYKIDSLQKEKFQALISNSKTYSSLSKNRGIVYLKVVFHIISSDDSRYISDRNIIEQLESLNLDFASANEDINIVPDYFKNSILTGSEIQFCLIDSVFENQNTPGIIRVNTHERNIGVTEKIFHTDEGGSDAIDTEKYINIWVVDFDTNLGGYASFPGQVPKYRDGIVINAKYFGRNFSSRYGLGRILTHEMGHYFGLQHIWGDKENCDSDDGITDTPNQIGPYVGCPDSVVKSCSTRDMYMNYMDYVDDKCMVTFSKEQGERMYSILNSGRRGLLIQGTGFCKNTKKNIEGNYVIYPNPSPGIFYVKGPFDFKEEGMTLFLYSIDGRLIIEKIYIRGEPINIKDYNQGIYIVKIFNDNKNIFTSKVIKL